VSVSSGVKTFNAYEMFGPILIPEESTASFAAPVLLGLATLTRRRVGAPHLRASRRVALTLRLEATALVRIQQAKCVEDRDVGSTASGRSAPYALADRVGIRRITSRLVCCNMR